MVNPGIYPPPDCRRYGTPHRAPYPQPYMSVDHRRTGSGHSSPFEPQRNMSSEDIACQRKRIPVACGRCRKRKIRCSGDTGDGSCTNCRNSGALPCQFLRVSSHETALRSEPGFNYNLSDSRTHHARGLTTVPSTQPLPATYPDGVPVDALPYRSSHAYAYGPGPSGRTHLPWSSAYYDTVSQHPDHGYQTHSLYIPTYPPQESRYTTSYQPPPAKSMPPYVDAEPTAYGFGSSSYGASTLAHRPAPSTADAGSGPWFHSIPGSSTGDKDTGMPSIDRPGLPQQSYVRNDSISSAAYSKSSSSPASSLPEMIPTSSYSTTSYESPPVSGYPTAGSSSQQHRSGDMYTTSSSSATANASSSSLDFPPPSTSKYVYQDTTVAAAASLAAAARHQADVSPSAYGPSSYDLRHVSDDREKSVSLRS